MCDNDIGPLQLVLAKFMDCGPDVRRRAVLILDTHGLGEALIVHAQAVGAGQMRLEMAKSLKKVIQDQGRQAYLILLDNIKRDLLMAFRDLDAFVVTACPRIAIDDDQIYEKPLITPYELEIALGMRDWADYKIDEIIYE